MCGIVGYFGDREVVPLLLSGLQSLAYRGYDSAGVVVLKDGGFTTADTPAGIDSVADLRRIGQGLVTRGYSQEAVRKILGENWIRVLRRALPP